MGAFWPIGMSFHMAWNSTHAIVQQDMQLLFLLSDSNKEKFLIGVRSDALPIV